MTFDRFLPLSERPRPGSMHNALMVSRDDEHGVLMFLGRLAGHAGDSDDGVMVSHLCAEDALAMVDYLKNRTPNEGKGTMLFPPREDDAGLAVDLENRIALYDNESTLMVELCPVAKAGLLALASGESVERH